MAARRIGADALAPIQRSPGKSTLARSRSQGNRIDAEELPHLLEHG